MTHFKGLDYEFGCKVSILFLENGRVYFLISRLSQNYSKSSWIMHKCSEYSVKGWINKKQQDEKCLGRGLYLGYLPGYEGAFPKQ